MSALAVRFDTGVVIIEPIVRPCTDHDCDHPITGIRRDTGALLTVPASLLVRVA
jgi:hypothetical protein